MDKKPQIVFRRIKGRIVPIRLSKSQKEKVKGSLSVAGGVGVGALSAGAAAKAVKVSAQMRIRAKKECRLGSALVKAAQRNKTIGEQMSFSFDQGMGSSWKKTQAGNRLKSRMLFKSRNLILGLGTFAASSLIIRGLDKFRKDQASVPVGLAEDTLLGGAVAGAIAGLYYRRLGLKGPKIFSFANARRKKLPRPKQIPIVTPQGTLRF